MELPSKYAPQQAESKWYQYWMENGYFRSTPDHRTPYTIVIPPPNVTGVLHMGHMLNNTIQDVLIRKARLQGFNACWVPGTDHASIATEAKVVAQLKEQGIEKSDLTREEFLSHAWAWKEKYGGVILEQLKKLGCSCDWERTAFTMDPQLSDSVIKVFVDLYNKGLIYRGYRMVHWDPEALTTLSDEEVIYEERSGLLYYVSYPLADGSDRITVATTRPETILGDTALCVHPQDKRYAHLIGKEVLVPITNRKVPVIADEYVDPEFGTGCLKITPAHDPNDYLIGQKHGLELIDIFHPNATLNSYGGPFEGMDRFEARKAVAKWLEEHGFLVKKENHQNKVGTSERTKAVIEPRLSDQWFLRMDTLVKPALEAVMDTQEIKLFPKKFENTYKHWLEGIRDWNISRQLWWGQQIPAYYYGDAKTDYVVAESLEAALVLAREKSGNTQLAASDLKRDEDALDTWFSSWLWPISVFNGILDPENPEIKYYYPTNDLVTGPDILFFWVARMIFAGYEYMGEKPFTNVYLTGLVRDAQRRKMSKSLGNSPDALKLIEDYGADGVRVGLLLSASAGNDLLFDEALCAQGQHFANKIWNGFRLVQSWEVADIPQPETAQLGIEWYRGAFNQALAVIEDHFEKYRISDALMALYKLIWDDYSAWLLEIIKPAYGAPIDKTTYEAVLGLLEQNLVLLHPFMPFLTEEIWQYIQPRNKEQALIIGQWPTPYTTKTELTSTFGLAAEVIAGVRNIRQEHGIPQKELLSLCVLADDQFPKAWVPVIIKLAHIEEVSWVASAPEGSASFRVMSSECFVPLLGQIDPVEELKKLHEELVYTQGFLVSVEKKLSNERFVQNAPEPVLALERKKQADALEKIEMLSQRIAQLS